MYIDFSLYFFSYFPFFSGHSTLNIRDCEAKKRNVARLSKPLQTLLHYQILIGQISRGAELTPYQQQHAMRLYHDKADGDQDKADGEG